MDEDFFWGDLLAHIRRQVLVPVVGPDLALVNVDGREQTFTSLIGQHLVEEYRLSAPAEVATTGEAVALVLEKRGRDEVDRLYRVIYDIINELDPAPGDALCDLAAIDDLRLFVSTTPDRLLAKAINKVRFQGSEETRESPGRGRLARRLGQGRRQAARRLRDVGNEPGDGVLDRVWTDGSALGIGTDLGHEPRDGDRIARGRIGSRSGTQDGRSGRKKGRRSRQRREDHGNHQNFPHSDPLGPTKCSLTTW